MDELENKLVMEAGFDRRAARKVIEFLRQHADEVIAALQPKPGMEDTLSSAFGDTIPGTGKPL